MSELSREQVEALSDRLMDALCDSVVWTERHIGELEYAICDGFAERIAPTVAAMLDEARAEVHERLCPYAAMGCTLHPSLTGHKETA